MVNMLTILHYPQLRFFLDGMLCMMVLYALCSYAQHRKAIYWQYALYIACMIISFYWDDIDYGNANYKPGTNLKVAVTESFAFLLYIRFAILLIDIPRLDPFSHKVLKILNIILAVEIILDILFYFTNTASEIKSINYIIFRCILSLGALVVVPRILKLHDVSVGYFIAGSFFFVLGCLFALGTNFLPGYFDRNPENPLSFPVTYIEFGVILEVLCFTLGMSVLNRRNERAKIEAQKQLIDQLQENEKKQTAILRIRDDISRDLHDELGADLSSISVMSYAALQQLKTNGDEVEKTIKHMGETSRKIITRMREIIWSLHSAHDSVGNFSFRLKETAYSVMEHQPIALHLELPREEVDARIPSEHRRNLFLVYKEILHNIVRHSKAQNVFIQMSIQSDHLNLTVKDDGIGFEYHSNKPKGNGLINLKQRTTVFAGTLAFESLPGEGTTVVVCCPLSAGSYSPVQV